MTPDTTENKQEVMGEPIQEFLEDNVDSTVGSEVKEKATQLRDSKGHFLPKGQNTEKEDPNVVKIKVIKEKKPRVPRNIVGKLNDLKERAASKFLESVIANTPNRILIDGKNYYSEKYVKKLREDVEIAERQERDAVECMEDMKGSTQDLLESSKSLLKELENTISKWKIWKALSIGLLVGYVIAFATAFARVYVVELEKNNPPSQTITETK